MLCRTGLLTPFLRLMSSLHIVVALLIACATTACSGDGGEVMPLPSATDSTRPAVTREVFVSGLSNPWDIAFLPNGEMLFTERPGRLAARNGSGVVRTIAQIADVVTGGEGGLMGLAVDPEFASNRFLYTCLSSRVSGSTDNRVVRWVLSADGTQLTDRRDIVTALPYANGGRHSGCRPRFGPDGQLWIGTGDAALGTLPQDLQSLGGKVLRVTRDGAAAPGNPTIAGADSRIYTYGHRNVQGIAFQPRSGAVFAVEQGPSFDDEVTVLVAGANAGWNPVPGYNESVSMTDLTRYPNAMRAVYSSGSQAKGTSGGGFLSGSAWKSWDGALVIGQLSGTRLLVITFTPAGAVATTTPLFDDLGTRLRTPLQGPDGSLYVTTDRSTGAGEIWRVTPR
jgi:aldose sugar dehydrogenase